MTSTFSLVEERLKSVETDPYLLELDQTAVFADILPRLTSVNLIELADALLRWRRSYPTGSYLLLRAIAVSSVAGEIAEAFARRLSCWEDDPEEVDAILAAGFAKFESAVQDWLSERPGLRTLVNGDMLPDHPPWGLDDRPLPPLPAPLPDINTIAGVQARLLLHEINCGPVTGAWSARTQAALHRLQYEYDHPNPGKLDSQTLEWLRSVEC